jgi:hypothetical protein
VGSAGHRIRVAGERAELDRFATQNNGCSCCSQNDDAHALLTQIEPDSSILLQYSAIDSYTCASMAGWCRGALDAKHSRDKRPKNSAR